MKIIFCGFGGVATPEEAPIIQEQIVAMDVMREEVFMGLLILKDMLNNSRAFFPLAFSGVS